MMQNMFLVSAVYNSLSRRIPRKYVDDYIIIIPPDFLNEFRFVWKRFGNQIHLSQEDHAIELQPNDVGRVSH